VAEESHASEYLAEASVVSIGGDTVQLEEQEYQPVEENK